MWAVLAGTFFQEFSSQLFKSEGHVIALVVGDARRANQRLHPPSTIIVPRRLHTQPAQCTLVHALGAAGKLVDRTRLRKEMQRAGTF